MKQSLRLVSSSSLLFALPGFVFAQDLGPIGGLFDGFLVLINDTLIPIVFALALLFFLWGMARWLILGGSDDEARSKGKSLALWSVIALVLMVSIWAIVALVNNSLGLDSQQNAPNIPNVPGRS
jgi:hypothetical protein